MSQMPTPAASSANRTRSSAVCTAAAARVRSVISVPDVIAAIEWAVANKDAYRLRVINLSLGKPVLESWVDDPLVQHIVGGVKYEYSTLVN